MKNNMNLIITVADFADNNDWNQSNHYELTLRGAIEDIPFSIHIISAGQCGEYIDADLEDIGWIIRDSLYGGGFEEKWNLNSSFTSVINDFIKFIDEVEQNPWRWA